MIALPGFHNKIFNSKGADLLRKNCNSCNSTNRGEPRAPRGNVQAESLRLRGVHSARWPPPSKSTSLGALTATAEPPTANATTLTPPPARSDSPSAHRPVGLGLVGNPA